MDNLDKKFDDKKFDDQQITVPGRVSKAKDGWKVKFEIRLGLFKLICIAHVPDDEDATSAPVYVKFRVMHREGNRLVESGRPMHHHNNEESASVAD